MQPVQPDHAKNKRTAAFAGGVVACMLGLAYASVPLYQLFCQVTGFGGTTQIATQAPKGVSEQTISIRFDANTSRDLGWTFHPVANTMTVRIGEVNLAYYAAENTGNKTTTGTAMFNVTPAEAGVFFNKIHCFCFTKQTLQPGQSVDMPVQFFVDPAILEDADTKSIGEITLSYTFYPATPDAPAKQAALKKD
jgi:cytochrome c oxidase assembly protein subunit 11